MIMRGVSLLFLLSHLSFYPFKIVCLFLGGVGVTESDVAQAGLELLILLPQPPQCLDYRCVIPPHLDLCCTGNRNSGLCAR